MWENKANNQNYKELTDWWIINNDDIMWEEIVPFIIPDFDDEDVQKDIPIVTLRADSTVVKVWDIVTFKAISNISSDNADFEKNRTFYYDFDWNWIWDLVTKQDEIKYTYIDSYEEGVTPRVAVEYKWKLGQAKWATILVVNERYLLNVKTEKVEGETIIITDNRYEKNKIKILLQLPVTWNIRQYMDWMFRDYEKDEDSYTNEERAEKLNTIRNTLIKDGKEENKWLDNEEDFTPYFCNIFDYYGIITYTEKCWWIEF